MRDHFTLCMLMALICTCAHAQDPITPEQAVEAVRAFCADPTLAVTVVHLADRGPESYEGFHYELRVEAGAWSGEYTVRATDGRVLGMVRDHGTAPEPPALTLQQAEDIAVAFARQRFAPFDQRQWILWPESWRTAGGEYAFLWTQVLNEHGTLAADGLYVHVNGTTGSVVWYTGPRDIISAPTVPQLTAQLALLLAAPYAVFDPELVPFDPNPVLAIYQDFTGVQYLTWRFYQYPDAGDPDLRYGVWIDAVTGDFVLYNAPFGMPPSGAGAIRPRTKLPSRPAMRTPQGSQYTGLVLHRGRLWVRAEALWTLGARVKAEEKRLQVQVGERAYEAKALGAERRDYGWWVKLARPANCPGWWVPLRRAAEAIGWQVKWHPKTREAVVTTDGTAPATAGS